MNTEIPLTPINKDARRFLSSGNANKTLRSALIVCGEKLSSFAAAAEVSNSLERGSVSVEYRVKVTKNTLGQFSVKMSFRKIGFIKKLAEMKQLECEL